MTDGQAERERRLTDQVVASFAAGDDRLREILTSLVEHLHGVVRDTRLTHPEWQRAIDFLTAAGAVTDDKRQEFILLSDVLGVSMQTIIVNDDPTGRATEASVVGPFYVPGSPRIERGGDIAHGAVGEPCWIEGRVTDVDGNPLGGAHLEVWEADEAGFYDVQYPDDRIAARGHLVADEAGRYCFWALTPTPYPIPADGPVGALLSATQRSPMRAPHLHFMVSHPGLQTIVTHVFVAGEDLTSDSVFGIRDSLVVDFERLGSEVATPDGRAIPGAWTRATFDLVLRSAAAGNGGHAAPGPTLRTRA